MFEKNAEKSPYQNCFLLMKKISKKKKKKFEYFIVKKYIFVEFEHIKINFDEMFS